MPTTGGRTLPTRIPPQASPHRRGGGGRQGRSGALELGGGVCLQVVEELAAGAAVAHVVHGARHRRAPHGLAVLVGRHRVRQVPHLHGAAFGGGVDCWAAPTATQSRSPGCASMAGCPRRVRRRPGRGGHTAIAPCSLPARRGGRRRRRARWACLGVGRRGVCRGCHSSTWQTAEPPPPSPQASRRAMVGRCPIMGWRLSRGTFESAAP
jgi:hypothetical protein